MRCSFKRPEQLSRHGGALTYIHLPLARRAHVLLWWKDPSDAGPDVTRAELTKQGVHRLAALGTELLRGCTLSWRLVARFLGDAYDSAGSPFAGVWAGLSLVGTAGCVVAGGGAEGADLWIRHCGETMPVAG